MNYEEVLESRDAKLLKIAKLPIGDMYKKLIDKKYQNVIKLRDDVVDDLVAQGDVDYECNVNTKLGGKHLLHFSPIRKEEHTIGLLVEQGNFTNVKEMIVNNPSIVATPDFVDNIVESILDAAESLHDHEVYHVCYDPSTILCRKGSTNLQLLCHGSYYANRLMLVYKDYKDFIAPELLDGGVPDVKSDIYSIGKFIATLFETREMPLNYKKVIERATNVNPEARYNSISELRSDIKVKGRLYRTLIIAAGIIIVLSIGTLMYLDTTREERNMEYVKPAPKEHEEDLLDKGFDAETELGVITNDTASSMTPEEKKQQELYQKKAEDIFRKQYSAKANAILSKIYNNSYMSKSEKQFMTGSANTTNELLKLQVDLASKAGISDSKSQKIASDIIESITKQKMNAIKRSQQE